MFTVMERSERMQAIMHALVDFWSKAVAALSRRYGTGAWPSVAQLPSCIALQAAGGVARVNGELAVSRGFGDAEFKKTGLTKGAKPVAAP